MSSTNDIQNQLQEIEARERQASIEKNLLIEKALKGGDANAIYQAQSYLKNIEKRQESNSKSMLIDPMTLMTGQGYKDKTHSLSYQMLRRMSRVPQVRAIIETRKEQISAFAIPQKDKYSVGFRIIPKKYSENSDKLTKQQEKEIEVLTEFILNCGTNSNLWHGDDFDSFLRKKTEDDLVLDQGCFEVVRDKKGTPVEFFAVDGATMRIADSYDGEHSKRNKAEEINGYYPNFVQVYQSRVVAEFYPWELCFGTRNQTTDIYSNGYGRSELEDLVNVVTNILNADAYNANYFKIGSNPKGILKVTGNINQTRINEFKEQWRATMAGVQNSHRMPVIEADKMDFINTQTSNKDMEYSRFYDFMLLITSALYKIDPSEIGFKLSGAEGSAPAMFEGNNEARLKYSKDKGLTPLLRYTQKQINKFLLYPITDKYTFEFVGLDAETKEQEEERENKAVTTYKTVNEVRRAKGLEDLEGGDIILNPVFLQGKQAQMMGGEQNNEAVEQYDSEVDSEQVDENPFEKSFNDYWNKLMSND